MEGALQAVVQDHPLPDSAVDGWLLMQLVIAPSYRGTGVGSYHYDLCYNIPVRGPAPSSRTRGGHTGSIPFIIDKRTRHVHSVACYDGITTIKQLFRTK